MRNTKKFIPRRSSKKTNKTNKTKKYRIFSKHHYSSGDGFLTSVWGPPAWFFLHTISFNYPVAPTKENKKQYKEFILSLQNVLPCRYCRENLTHNLKIMPLTDDKLADRCSFSRYIYDLHELVNKRLGKKSGLTYNDVRERYEHFRSRCTVDEVKLKKEQQQIDEDKENTGNKNKEKGCVEPLYGKKSKCLLKIVPQEEKAKTIEIDKKCLKHKK
jgi:hypothetical protein